MPSADEVIAAYQDKLGRAPDASEIASELDNASRNGDSWFTGQFQKNLDERAAPTASAGGSGGDIDLDGNGVVDNGWYLIDSADTGDPGWVQKADLGKLSPNVTAFDVGGDPASAVVAAFFQAEGMYNNAQEAARKEIDRLNLTGAFDDAGGQSEAGIAAARAKIGSSIFGAERSKLGSLLGYSQESIASSSGSPVSQALGSGRSVLSPVARPSVLGPSTGLRPPTGTVGAGGAPGTAVLQSYRDPTKTVGAQLATAGGTRAAGLNPTSGSGLLMMAALGLAAWWYLK